MDEEKKKRLQRLFIEALEEEKQLQEEPEKSSKSLRKLERGKLKEYPQKIGQLTE